MAISKPDFIAKVAEKSELNKKEATAAVDAFLATVEETLVNGDSVSFVGFGSFEVRERAAVRDVTHVPVKKLKFLRLRFQHLRQESL